MATIELTQEEAEALIALEKHRADDSHYSFPAPGQSVSMLLQSEHRRELFSLDLHRGRIDLRKIKMQGRGRQTVVLVRLDLGGAPHRNPDGEEVSAPHLHIYREGYGDKWAFAVPAGRFPDLSDPWRALKDFMMYCNITIPPFIDRDLFL